MLKLRKSAPASINPESASELGSWSEEPLNKTPYWPLLGVLAEMLDSAAKGQNTYCVIGTTKDRSAISVTVKVDGGGDARYGETLGAVSNSTADWL